jgi:hypothetical protein
VVIILLKESQGQIEDLGLVIWSDGSEIPIDGDLESKKGKGHAECFSGKSSKVISRICEALFGRMDQSFDLTSTLHWYRGIPFSAPWCSVAGR